MEVRRDVRGCETRSPHVSAPGEVKTRTRDTSAHGAETHVLARLSVCLTSLQTPGGVTQVNHLVGASGIWYREGPRMSV